jgi:hypothetical protein
MRFPLVTASYELHPKRLPIFKGDHEVLYTFQSSGFRFKVRASRIPSFEGSITKLRKILHSVQDRF